MKVSISCAGRFHAYDLAGQLNRFGLLQQLITTYPKSEVSRYGIPREKIISFIYWEVLNRGWFQICQMTGIERSRLQAFINEAYDRIQPAFLSPHADTFIGWTSNAERGLAKAKSFGAVTILESGSAHIEFQTMLLMEEHEKYNRKKTPVFTHPQVIEKAQREYALADWISVPSSFVKRSFIERGIPANKLFQNPYGVDLRRFRPGHKSDDVFRFIYVGQMSLRKGVHYLLEAFAGLGLPKSELVLIGSMTPEIEPYFEAHKGSYSYLGTMRQDDLPQHYAMSSVFIICSIEEGMAMVQLQAMACGLPLICTEHTGGEDLIQNGVEGFIIPIRDVKAIQEKITWMYEHPVETRNMGALAREKVETGYSWNEYGERYIAFLRQIHAADSK